MKIKNHTNVFGGLALTFLIFLSYLVTSRSAWLQPFDETITQWIRQLAPAGNSFFLWITRLANPLTIIGFFLAVLFLLLYGKKYIEAAWFSLGVIGIAGIVNPIIKLLFRRERPDLEHLVSEHSFSFPSGHSVASMVFYGTLICLVPLFIQNLTLQKLLQFFLGSLIFLIGTSRIYLGVHFPSDILGGFLLGFTWLLVTYPIFKKNLEILKVKEGKKK